MKTKRLNSIYAIVQARMSSVRLPCKVLRKVCGQTLLEHLINRLNSSNLLAGVVIATSIDNTDDAIFEFSLTNGFACFRGDLFDVATRLLGAAKQFGIDHILRVSGDSPMLDPAIVDRAIGLYQDNEVDLVTNVQQRTFPKGQSVEVFSTKILELAIENSRSIHEMEHVTPVFYNNSTSYRILNFVHPDNLGELQLSVDTQEDLDRFGRIMDYLGPPFFKHDLGHILAAQELIDK